MGAAAKLSCVRTGFDCSTGALRSRLITSLILLVPRAVVPTILSHGGQAGQSEEMNTELIYIYVL
jgi:hypothetical protein